MTSTITPTESRFVLLTLLLFAAGLAIIFTGHDLWVGVGFLMILVSGACSLAATIMVLRTAQQTARKFAWSMAAVVPILFITVYLMLAKD